MVQTPPAERLYNISESPNRCVYCYSSTTSPINRGSRGGKRDILSPFASHLLPRSLNHFVNYPT